MSERVELIKQTHLIIHEEIIDAISRGVLSKDCSVYLTGSAGHSEEAVAFTASGEAYLWNDVDLLIVTSHRKFLKKDLSAFVDGLKARLGVMWVDVTLVKPSKLRELPDLIKNQDMVSGRILIYGEAREFHIKHTRRSHELRRWDLFLLFRTRCFCITDSYVSENGFHQPFTRQYRAYQLAKAVLAAVDARLLSEDEYCASYSGRIRKFLRLFECGRKNQLLIELAYRIKICPSTPLSSVEFDDFIFQAREFFWLQFKCAFFRLFSINLQEAAGFEKLVIKYEMSLLKRLYRMARSKKDLSLWRYEVQIVQYLIARYICTFDGFDFDGIRLIKSDLEDLEARELVSKINEFRMRL